MCYCTTYENAFEEHLWLLMGGAAALSRGDLCSTADFSVSFAQQSPS
jgi:hypothetical protein